MSSLRILVITFLLWQLAPAEGQCAVLGRFAAWAPPGFWGTSQNVVNHWGVVNLTISYRPEGSTLVKGEITYYPFDLGGEQTVTKEFIDSIKIKTADVVASISVRFKGIPLGSAVSGVVLTTDTKKKTPTQEPSKNGLAHAPVARELTWGSIKALYR